MTLVRYAGADRDTRNYRQENRAASTHEGWTDERVELLRELAAKKRSASEIAKELGAGATRNTVIGKATRLGIKIDSGARGLTRPKMKRPAPPPTPSRTPSPATSPGAQVNGSGKHASDCRAGEGRLNRRRSEDVGTAAAVERSAAALKPAPDIFEPIARPCTISELTAEHCRWPLGNPSDLDTFRYCGAQTTNQKRATAASVPGGESPYCAGHHRLAYNGARG